MRHRSSVIAVVLLSATLALQAAAGCADRTTRTTQTVTTEEPAAGSDTAPQPATAHRTETTSTTTTDSGAGSPGIIGSAFGLVWAVISFPFRVVGALF